MAHLIHPRDDIMIEAGNNLPVETSFLFSEAHREVSGFLSDYHGMGVS